MTTVTRKIPRYIDLLGDPIEKSPLIRALDSHETYLTLIASGLVMSLENPLTKLNTGLLLLWENIEDIALYRLVFEKIALGGFDKSFFISQETLKNICIDTLPDAQTSMKSVQKHGLDITRAKTFYSFWTIFNGLLTGITTSSSLLLNQTDELPHWYASMVSSHSRDLRGLYRFNKLAKGDWAITSTPDKQEYVEKDLFRIPFIQKSPAPVFGSDPAYTTP